MEITTDVNLIKTGDKVGASEATLLAKLGIKPFSYGLIVDYVSIYETSLPLLQCWALPQRMLTFASLYPRSKEVLLSVRGPSL